MRVTAPTVVALCSLAALACGGSGVGSVAIGDLGPQDLAALCDYEARCGAVTSGGACAAAGSAAVASGVSLLVAVVANGTTKYDPDKAAQCLDWLRARSCDQSQRDQRVQADACVQAFKGTVADGGACASSVQCVSASCGITSCADSCCVGTCRATRPAPAALGQPCGTGGCAPDTYCTSANVCAALLPEGQGCGSNEQCTYGTVCTGSSTRVCAKTPAEGGACLAGGSGSPCPHGLFCDSTNHCARLAGVGASCSSGVCASDLACDQGSHTCLVPPPAGSPCVSERCGPGAYCQPPSAGAAALCVTSKADGQACARSHECQSLSCQKGICAQQAACIKP